MLESFKSSVCSSIRVRDLGLDEYMVHTGFTYADGDEFHIILRTTDEEWVLSDEGHTLMWLSYEDFTMTPVRADLFERILNTNSVQNENGALTVRFDPGMSGQALYSLVQAIMQVSDLRFMSKTRVLNTFIDDIKELFKSSEMNPRCRFDLTVETPKGGVFTPDIYIEEENPILVFGITNTDNCRDAVINMLELQRSPSNYRYFAIVEDLEGITVKDRQRLMRSADKTVEGLGNLMQSIERFISISETRA
ncbi:MAG: DUF1828 domain-containing protein [Methanomassiliicoccaceae archaeon]|nr:DUF1828 domain-containing protein [Methanomassiliicoccaceae archaeon]